MSSNDINTSPAFLSTESEPSTPLSTITFSTERLTINNDAKLVNALFHTFDPEFDPSTTWDAKSFSEYSSPSHCLTRYLTGFANSPESTQRAVSGDLYHFLRDYFTCQYDLPTPEFDDVAMFFAAYAVCREAEFSRGKNHEQKAALQVYASEVLKSKLVDTFSDKAPGRELTRLLPGFSVERKNGRLRMRLAKPTAKQTFKADINRVDRAAIDIILKRIEASELNLWPHLIVQEVINVNLQEYGARGVSASALNRRLSHIKGFESYLSRQGTVHRHSHESHFIKGARREKKIQPSFLPEEMSAILRNLDKRFRKLKNPTRDWKLVRDRAMIYVLDATLLRNDSIGSLEIDDLNLKKETVRARTGKRRKERYLALTEVAIDALKDWLEVRNTHVIPVVIKDSRYSHLFCTNRGKVPNRKSFWHSVGNAAECAGIDCYLQNTHWGPHSWRRGLAAQIYIETGGDIHVVQNILGHEDSKTTMDYIQSALERIYAEQHQRYHPRSKKNNRAKQ